MRQNKKLEFDEIEYLAFKGGGAKGGTYLGALCAMVDIDSKKGNRMFPGLADETEGNLMNDTKIGEGCIQGVSGSSVGAIFGMCVAMGYTPEQINARLITDRMMASVTKEKL